MDITRFPLTWPFGWPRTGIAKMRRSEFGDHSIAECTQEIVRQLNLLRASSIVISTNLKIRGDGLPYSNQRQPNDPGVAVYFKLHRFVAAKVIYDDRVLACDKWDLVEDNLWSVAKHVDALRGQQRWGVGNIEQAFAGYTALPPGHPASPDPWWSVLGVGPTASEELIRDAYRALAKQWHPDMPGGDASKFHRIQAAYETALKERRP